MSEKPAREQAPAEVRVLEPDLLGAISLFLYGRDEPARRRQDPPRFPAGWRGMGRRQP
jgi:hypothetical protein